MYFTLPHDWFLEQLGDRFITYSQYWTGLCTVQCQYSLVYFTVLYIVVIIILIIIIDLCDPTNVCVLQAVDLMWPTEFE